MDCCPLFSFFCGSQTKGFSGRKNVASKAASIEIGLNDAPRSRKPGQGDVRSY